MTVQQDKVARLAAIREANAARRVAAAASQLPDDFEPAMAGEHVLGLLFAAAGGAMAAVVVLPTVLPGLSASLLGPEPKAYWLLSRSSAVVAYVLLWASMLCGLLMTTRLAQRWPGRAAAFDLHQHTSLLGLAFALFHALVLLGDRYISASVAQILVPFAYRGYSPVWVGLGQIGLYGLALVGLSFYARRWIGRTGWRLIHFLSFAVFCVALIHGIASGSDSGAALVRGLYWASGASVLFLTLTRMLARFSK